MRREERHLWRIKWAGRWTTTNHHATEADIRREHPEAVIVPNSMQIILVPETPDEIAERDKSMRTNPSTKRYHPDGTVKKSWEA